MHTVNSKLHLETQMFQHVLDQKNLVSLMCNVSELEKDISNTYFTSKWHWSMQADFICVATSKKPSLLLIVFYIMIKDKMLLAFPSFYKQDLFNVQWTAKFLSNNLWRKESQLLYQKRNASISAAVTR